VLNRLRQEAQLSLERTERTRVSEGQQMIFVSCESYFLLLRNRKLGPISHCFCDTPYRLSTIARTDVQNHSRSMIFVSSEGQYVTSC